MISLPSLISTDALAERLLKVDGELLEAVTVEVHPSPESSSRDAPLRPSVLDSVHIRFITYVSDGLPVKGWLIEPRTPGRYPAIIFNRGGYGEFGALGTGPVLVQLADLAADGYVVVASQYRGTAGAPGHDELGGAEVADVLNLIPLLRSLDTVDASKIGMMGHSRGGMMTYIALARSSPIKAAVIVAGTADLARLARERPAMNRVYEKAITNNPSSLPAELRDRSAVHWVDRLPKETPLLLLHGTADWRVSPRDSLGMASLLLKERVPFRLVLFEGGDHGLTEHGEEMRWQIHSWFRRYLQEGAALPNLEPHGD